MSETKKLYLWGIDTNWSTREASAADFISALSADQDLLDAVMVPFTRANGVPADTVQAGKAQPVTQYYDIDGNPCSFDVLCRKEPEWAASRIRVMTEQLAVSTTPQPGAPAPSELRQYELLVEALQWLPVGTVVDFCDRDDFIEEVRRDGWRPLRECKDHVFVDTDRCVYCHWEPGDPEETEAPAAEAKVTVEPRPVVHWFAEQMELALRRNDHKGGWHTCKPYDLARRVDQESAELLEALCLGRVAPVLSEAADVANMAMMVADHYRNGGPSRDQGHDVKLSAPPVDGEGK